MSHVRYAKDGELLVNHTSIPADPAAPASEQFSNHLLAHVGFIIEEFIKWKWKPVAVEEANPAGYTAVPLVYITLSVCFGSYEFSWPLLA